MKKKSILFISILVILFIWLNSSIQGNISNELSRHFTTWIYDTFQLELDFHSLHVFIRKSAHFIEYAFLGVLLCGLVQRFIKKHVYLLPVLFAFLIASADETIQYFTPNRNGQFKDVLLDLCGAVFGIFIYNAIKKIRKRINK